MVVTFVREVKHLTDVWGCLLGSANPDYQEFDAATAGLGAPKDAGAGGNMPDYAEMDALPAVPNQPTYAGERAAL